MVSYFKPINNRNLSSPGSGETPPIGRDFPSRQSSGKQKSKKTWMHDVWGRGAPGPYGAPWDGSSEVWRTEYHLTREFFRNLKNPIESPYDLLDQFRSLWSYATGQIEGDADGLPDGWLRYVMATEDSNRSRWPVHPAWVVVQSAFAEPFDPALGLVVRQRIREVNLERGLAAMVGYSSTLATWLGGHYVAPESDISLTLQWLYDQGQEYLLEKGRDFCEEIKRLV